MSDYHISIFAEEFPKEWKDFLCLPDNVDQIIASPIKDSKEGIKILIEQTNHPRIFITVGSKWTKLFDSKINLKKHAGQFFWLEGNNTKHILCPLRKQTYYKIVKGSKEYKQLEMLKKFLIKEFGYGLLPRSN